MSMEGTMGAMPVYNVCDNQQMGSGGNWIWVLVLLMLFGWGGVGFGGRNDIHGFATQQDIVNGFNFNQLDNGIRGLERGLCQLGYDSLMQTKDIQYQLAQNAFQSQQCLNRVKKFIKSLFTQFTKVNTVGTYA